MTGAALSVPGEWMIIRGLAVRTPSSRRGVVLEASSPPMKYRNSSFVALEVVDECGSMWRFPLTEVAFQGEAGGNCGGPTRGGRWTEDGDEQMSSFCLVSLAAPGKEVPFTFSE